MFSRHFSFDFFFSSALSPSLTSLSLYIMLCLLQMLNFLLFGLTAHVQSLYCIDVQNKILKKKKATFNCTRSKEKGTLAKNLAFTCCRRYNHCSGNYFFRLFQNTLIFLDLPFKLACHQTRLGFFCYLETTLPQFIYNTYISIYMCTKRLTTNTRVKSFGLGW